jgi:hypothetical protein
MPGSRTILVALRAERNDIDLDDDLEHNDDSACVGARRCQVIFTL